MQRVVGADEKSGAAALQLLGRGEHEPGDALPVVAVDALHVVGQRMRVHRDFGVCMSAEKRRTLNTNGAIAKCRAFGGARDDPDVPGHKKCGFDPEESLSVMHAAQHLPSGRRGTLSRLAIMHRASSVRCFLKNQIR
jgi:hypothetical protein